MEDNNNLEKFFRQKFNQKIEPQDWNSPNNEVWENIARNIPEEKRKRRLGILPLIFVSGLAVLSLLLGYDNYQKDKNIIKLKQELKECSNETMLSNGKDNSSLKSNNGNNSSSVNSLQSLNRSSTNNELESDVLVDPTNLNEIRQVNLNTQQTKVLTNLEDKGIISKMETKEFELTKNTESKDLVNILPIPIIINTLISDQKTFAINERLKDVTKPLKKPNRNIAFGPIARYIHWEDKISGKFDNPLSELLISENTSPSIAMGIGLCKKIASHFYLNTGILYYQRNQSSQYAINLPYSTINEVNVGGEFENRFEHSLPTGLGNINTSLVLSRSINSSVSNNESVSLDFSLQNHTKALSVPITLSYYLKQSGDGFFFQAGIINEFIIKNEIRGISTESHHTFVKDKSIVVNYNTSQINKINLSTIMGLGYDKQLFNDVTISLSAHYGFSFTNTFATPNYQHKIDQLGCQLLVAKTIN